MDEQHPISFVAPEIRKCPFPAYARLRKEAPVYQDPFTGLYVLTRYADIRDALLNVAQLSNKSGMITNRQSAHADKIRQLFEEKGWVQLDMLPSDDPPSHKMYRAVVDKIFTAARVDGMEGKIETVVNALIDDFIGNGEVEFVSQFAVPLPMRIIADELGAAHADLPKFKRWSDLTVETLSPVIPADRELEIAPEIIEMQNYFARVVESVRRSPTGNLVSALAQGTVEGRSLTMQEIVIIMQNFMVAGNETTASALSHGMQLMIENPGAVSAMRQNPEAILRFIDEILRLRSPVQGLFRKAKEDIEIAGVRIPKGAIVQVQYGAANHDPEMFSDPDKLDIARSNANKHLAFGAGIHHCVGHQLARKELLVAFRTILKRMTNLRGARGTDSFVIADSFTTFGLSALYLAFDTA